jgi:release factor glutamine methyltransferase
MIAGLLTEGGVAAIEIGHDQRESVSGLLRAERLGVAVRKDMAGHDRCLIATRPSES